MQKRDTGKRAYYDHEGLYQKNAEKGYLGWCEKFDVGLFEELIGRPWRPLPCRAVDLGCGGGLGAIYFAGLGFKTVGIDYSHTAITLARKNAIDEPSASFLTADVLNPPFSGKTFEFAVSKLVLHCLIGKDRLQFLLQARRILAPGGLLFLSTIAGMPHDLETKEQINPRTRVDRTRSRCFLKKEDILQEIKKTGFSIKHAEVKAHKSADVLVVHALRS